MHSLLEAIRNPKKHLLCFATTMLKINWYGRSLDPISRQKMR